MFTSANKKFWFSAPLTLIALIVLGANRVEARMYQWSNEATGTVQLSGTPPAWYRSASSGPRVFVFDNGVLIDDTAVPVSEDHRQLLRSNAFGPLEMSDRSEPSLRSQDELLGALENANREGIDVTAITEAFTTEIREAEAIADDGMVEQTVAELKALLDAWDSRRLIEAKALLQNATEPVE